MVDAELVVSVNNNVMTLTINRPEKRNAMSVEVINNLKEALISAKVDNDVRVVVITGQGDKAFCSGADLSGGMMDQPKEQTLIDQHNARGQLAEIFNLMYELGKPTVARVNGYAMAGGFGLALACDIVIAATHSKFGATEVNVGLWPFMISVPLSRSMPPKRALELMMTGRKVSAQEGAEIGFVNSVVEFDGLDNAVNEVTSRMASLPPAAIKLGRTMFYATLNMEPHQALGYLQTGLSLTTLTEDAREGVLAFLEKRPPNFTGS